MFYELSRRLFGGPSHSRDIVPPLHRPVPCTPFHICHTTTTTPSLSPSPSHHPMTPPPPPPASTKFDPPTASTSTPSIVSPTQSVPDTTGSATSSPNATFPMTPSSPTSSSDSSLSSLGTQPSTSSSTPLPETSLSPSTANIIATLTSTTDGKVTSSVVTLTSVKIGPGVQTLTTTNSDGAPLTFTFGSDPVQTSAGSDSTPSANSAIRSGATGSSSHAGAIVGGIIGALVFILLIVAFILIRRRRKALKTAPSSEFLVRNQYPFLDSGSQVNPFPLTRSYHSNNASFQDIVEPFPASAREPTPRASAAHEKMALV